MAEKNSLVDFMVPAIADLPILSCKRPTIETDATNERPKNKQTNKLGRLGHCWTLDDRGRWTIGDAGRMY